MRHWHDYTTLVGDRAHTVVGTLRVSQQVWSPQLRNRRDILVYLPPSYATGTKRYPVLYMHDGQNLFDESASYAGEWRVDETFEQLSSEGIEALVVGIPNAGSQRLAEYSPPLVADRPDQHGDRYLEFITETLKPRIDRTFRTLPAAQHTGLIGSSLGGLISLYGFFRYPEVFGLAGVLSPSLWLDDAAIFPYVEQAPVNHGRIYLDMGLLEGRLTRRSRVRTMPRAARRMRKLLVAKGYKLNRDVCYVEDAAGIHHESAWARRLLDGLRFLLRPAHQR